MARKRSGAWSAGITGAALGIAAGTALGAYVLAPEGGIEWGGAQAAEERDAAIVERDSANTRADAANSVVEDLAAQRVGIPVFLLTPCLINPKEHDLSNIPHGDFAELKKELTRRISCKK